MIKKGKKVYLVLHYIEQLLALISTVCGCNSISVFSPLVLVKNTVTDISNRDLKVEEIVGRFYIKEFQKNETNQKEF